MTLNNLLTIINEAESIQVFAEDNLLKLADSKDGRYILNYSEQLLDTPKNWVSHYCRGLTLAGTPKNYTIIAKSFDRFYNLGENPDYIKDDYNIDFNKPFYVDFKYDGSLILLYYWDNCWRVNTRGSFGQGVASTLSDKTWEELFWEGFDLAKNSDMRDLDKSITYIAELCSPYNQVVEYYPTTSVAHLSAMNADGKEIYKGNPNNICNSLEEVNQKLSQLTATQEGFVLVQWSQEKEIWIRRKVKTESWVALSHLKESVCSSESKIWDIIFGNDYADVVAVFPHLKEPIIKKEKQYKEFLLEVENNFTKFNTIENQKDFAIAIKDISYKGVLFAARSGKDLKDNIQKYIIKNY